MENGKIYAISVSEERGTLKREVEECIVTPQGLEGDGHAGDWSRQITCLRYESLAASQCETRSANGAGRYGGKYSHRRAGFRSGEGRYKNSSGRGSGHRSFFRSANPTIRAS